MSGKKPTPKQQEARDKGNKEFLVEAAKHGNKKAQELLKQDGGKK